MAILLMILMGLTSLFLILLILIQRGKGGGLAGAFGGMGGQSAFGTKAGDTFTRITIGVAAVWILLCMVAVWTSGGSSGPLKLGGPSDGAFPAAEETGLGPGSDDLSSEGSTDESSE
jgi:preprotein translocase subunit SecG